MRYVNYKLTNWFVIRVRVHHKYILHAVNKTGKKNAAVQWL